MGAKAQLDLEVSKAGLDSPTQLKESSIGATQIDLQEIYAQNSTEQPSELADSAANNVSLASDSLETDSTKKTEIRDGEVISATANTFNAIVSGSPYPTFLVVTQEGCGWCAKEAPVLKFLAEKYSGEIRIVTLDKAELMGLPDELNNNVIGFPTFIVFDQGAVLGVMPGYRSKEDLTTTIEHLLAQDEKKQPD